ncbi:YccF domain-containing protein [Halobellus rufus]|uniref:YccF domain-containing protein n=1 Tax=Halobellus rufus TaxID=1448860 RepID=UPI001E4C48CB|nr:YccF domain-containing protein [Halobellus rufus]
MTDSGARTNAAEAPDGGRNVTVERRDGSPSIVVRAAYFLLIGWWASGIWLGVAWFFTVTIVGTPIGIKMINLIPKVVSLKERTVETRITENASGAVTVTESGRDQHSLVVRAAYFLLIGWWASGIWMSIAWVFSVTIIGLPVAVWMYDRLPYVVSLYKY